MKGSGSPQPSPPESGAAKAHPATVRELRWWCGNSLTISRIVAASAYPLLPAAWRLPVLVYCALSDFADGWLSRKLRATSLLGQFLDPIADKLCVAAVLLTALAERELKLWELLLVTARDWSVLLLALYAARQTREAWRRMPARWSGKCATAAQFLFLVNIVSGLPRVPGLFAVTAGVSVLAALDYAALAVREYRQEIRRSRQAPD